VNSRHSQIGAAVASAVADRLGPIAILLNSDARYIAAMLGVLAAARGYVPLDANHPYERSRLIAMQAGACAVVSAGTISEQLRALFPPNVPIIDVDLLDASVARPFDIRPATTDIASILFTSGSTGKPKGVPLSHRNLLHDVGQYTNAFHITSKDRISMLYSPSVVAGARDIYAALLNGASLHIIPPSNLQATDLIKEIYTRRITIYDSAPALFRRVAERLGGTERLESVRVACLMGERIEWHDVDACRRAFSPGVSVYMGLGSTECICARWFVDDSLRQTAPRPPVGRPFPNRTVLIIDEKGEPVANGEVGEIWIKSRYIPECYWRAPELTGAAFVTDKSDPSSRIFKTGDLARQRADGLLEFKGRKDRQIKLHGHRIEPGEIESVLRSLPEVRDAAIHIRRDNAGAPTSLIAYVVLWPTIRDLLPRQLLTQLSQRLPRHMVPSQVVFIDDLPRSPNLKVDLAQLASIDADRMKTTHQGQHAARALTDTERQLASLWKQVLKLESLPSLDDNFFELGGDSIASAEMIFTIEEKFSCQLPIDAFFQFPTIATLHRLLKQHGAASRSNSGEPPPNGAHRLLHKLQAYSGSWQGERLFPGSFVLGMNVAGYRTPIFWVFQDQSEFVQLAKHLGPDQPLYGMRSCVGIIDVKDHSTEIIEIVCNRYLWEILALPIKTPFVVGGNCQGGIFALALARRLKQIGRTPRMLILMEWTYSYGRYPEPTLLLYGDQSDTAEIYLKPAMRTPSWREDFPRNTVASIPGMHGHFFTDNNVSGLAKTLKMYSMLQTTQTVMRHPENSLLEEASMNSDVPGQLRGPPIVGDQIRYLGRETKECPARAFPAHVDT